MGQLQYLQIDESETLFDLHSISNLKQLKVLTVLGAKNLFDISDVGKLKSLEYLTLYAEELPADLSPLAELKKLKVLVVTKDDLKERKAEFDKLQEQLPNTKIVGYCMGSGWLIAILVGGVVAGLGMKKFKALAGTCPKQAT